jgi:hypothetical protein
MKLTADTSIDGVSTVSEFIDISQQQGERSDLQQQQQ